jgi:competence ComEA-like helix-hairpin-helix protein
MVLHFVDFSEESVFDIHSKEIIALQREMDSIREAELRSRQKRVYTFNPNYIDDHKGYLLGMTPDEIDRLLAFRAKGAWINSSAEFQEITKVSDSLLNALSPRFKFPEWVHSKRTHGSSKEIKKHSYDDKSDINTATAEELQEIYGIGKSLSKRIIDFRSRLGGYTSDIQLYHVYGLNEETVNRLLNEFTVKTPKQIDRMNLNIVSASDLSTIPGISFELAREVWEKRVLNDGFESFSELREIEGMTERKLELIELYLSLE